MAIRIIDLDNAERTRAEIVSRFQNEIGKMTDEKQRTIEAKEAAIVAGDIAGAADAITKLSLLDARIEAAQTILDRQISEPLFTVDQLVECVNGLIDGEADNLAKLMKAANEAKSKYFAALKALIVKRNHLAAKCTKVLKREKGIEFFCGVPHVRGLNALPALPKVPEMRILFEGLDSEKTLNALQNASLATSLKYVECLEGADNDE